MRQVDRSRNWPRARYTYHPYSVYFDVHILGFLVCGAASHDVFTSRGPLRHLGKDEMNEMSTSNRKPLVDI
jgi:hypothetical protein